MKTRFRKFVMTVLSGGMLVGFGIGILAMSIGNEISDLAAWIAVALIVIGGIFILRVPDPVV
jgi:hypothetical protein